MEQIIFLTKFSKLGFQNQLRLDAKYRYFKDEKDNTTELLRKSRAPGVSLNNILELANTPTIKKGELEEEMILVDLENIEPGFGTLKEENIVNEIGSDKTFFNDADIIYSKLTPEKGHCFLNDKSKKIIGTTELIGYKIKSQEWNIKFLMYLLIHKEFRKDLEFLTSGKTHPRIHIPDFLAMKIPMVPYDRQNETVNKIEELENKISSIKNKIESIQDIIDDVFIENFNLKSSEKINKFNINFSSLSTNRNNQLRISYHFSHPQYKKILDDLSGIKKIPLKKIFKISGGKRLPKGKSFSREETNYRYLRPNEIKDFQIDYENMPYISDKIYSILSRYEINNGDFAISIVGTLGKIAWLKLPEEISDQKIILSENFAKLEIIDSEIDKHYLFYFLNSLLLKTQINREYTITTQMKLGLDKLAKLFIIIPESEKILKKIVSEIQQREEKSNQYKEQIKKLREEIDNLIYQCLG